MALACRSPPHFNGVGVRNFEPGSVRVRARQICTTAHRCPVRRGRPHLRRRDFASLSARACTTHARCRSCFTFRTLACAPEPRPLMQEEIDDMRPLIDEYRPNPGNARLAELREHD